MYPGEKAVCFMLLAGAKDVEAGAVSFRFRDDSQVNGVPVDEAVTTITGWITQRLNSSPTANDVKVEGDSRTSR